MSNQIVEVLAVDLQAEIRALPKDLARIYDAFEFTETGKNLCHPITWGLIVKAVSKLQGVAYVGVDVRLNDREGHKFQPDVVGYSAELRELVFVDFESPNSSDARIPKKDVDPYLAWSERVDRPVPYVIITSLPDRPAEDWEIRWLAKGQTNDGRHGDKAKIKKNPFQYWRRDWAKKLSKKNLSNILLLNIDANRVVQVNLHEK